MCKNTKKGRQEAHYSPYLRIPVSGEVPAALGARIRMKCVTVGATVDILTGV